MFTYDTKKAWAEKNKKIIIVKEDPACQYVTYDNYTSCVDTDATSGDKATEVVDPSRVFILYPTTSGTYENHTKLQAGKTVKNFLFTER